VGKEKTFEQDNLLRRKATERKPPVPLRMLRLSLID